MSNSLDTYNIFHLESDIDKISRHIFQDVWIPSNRFDTDGESLIRRDLRMFKYFIDNYLKLHRGEKVRGIFSIKNNNLLVYWFIGETYRYLQDKGQCRTSLIEFTNNNFIIDSKGLYCMLLVLIKKLNELGINVNKFGIRKYLTVGSKKNYFDKFIHEINRIKNKPLLLSKIFTINKKENIIVNQYDALRMSKKMTFKEVYSICTDKGNFFTLNSEQLMKQFKSSEGLEKAAEKLFKKAKECLISFDKKRMIYFMGDYDQRMKKYRLSLKACKSYIKYIALCNVMQNRENRPLELNANAEKKYFSNGYKILSQAAEKLGYKKCIDKTYFRGIRSRTYFLRLFSNNEILKNHNKFNNIELKFIKLNKKEEKDDFAMNFGIGGRYLYQKEQMYLKLQENKYVIKENFKLLKIKGYAQLNGVKAFDEVTKNRYIINRNKMLLNTFNEAYSEQRFYRNKQMYKNITAIEGLVYKCG